MTGRAAGAINLVFVGHRCCDHSPSSGYDQVCALLPEAGWLNGPALAAGRVEWYRERQGVAAATVPLFHVFYGDCSGRELPAILRQRFPSALIISSVHKPVARLLEDPVARQAVEASDAIITVSQLQADDLATLRLPGTVHAIPHGVWTRVFRPAARSARPREHVLIVGSFLRDWEGASRVVLTLAEHGVRSVAVGAGAREHLRREDLPVEVLPRVSEDELVALYESAAAVFLPFLDATASNALVEAMAAGCPIVCPRFPSLVHEYLPDGSDAFEIGQYERAAERLIHYVRNPAEREARSHQLMATAEAFDWARLKPRYEAIYENVAARAEIAYGLV